MIALRLAQSLQLFENAIAPWGSPFRVIGFVGALGAIAYLHQVLNLNHPSLSFIQRELQG